MKITPRPYQIASVNETRTALVKHKRVLIVAPTASGKTIIQALIVESAYRKRKPRILILCHQAHLLEQTETQIKQMIPTASTGIYCAGLNRKQTHQDIILASRDSLGNNPEACGKFDLILADEAHLIDADALKTNTKYGRIFKAQKKAYVIGLTGTPWRLGNGNIWGNEKFFTTISYNIGMRFLIEQRFLSDYTFPKIKSKIDTSNIKSARGDFVNKELTAVSSTEDVVSNCIDTWVDESKNRKCSIFFCCSIVHAKVVFKELKKRRVKAVYIDGATKDRDQMFRDIKNGEYDAIVNIGVMTTGFDAPIIDCVVMLRATQSASLYVQCIGRGLRLHPNKKDCLILDMAGNTTRFGSIESPKLKEDDFIKYELKEDDENTEKKKGAGPTKQCPSCKMTCAASCKVCGFCCHIFISHTSVASKGSKIYTISYIHAESRLTQKKNTAVVYTFNVNERKKPFEQWCITDHSNKWVRLSAKEFIKKFKGYREPKTIICSNPSDRFPSLSLEDWSEYKNDCKHLYVSAEKEGEKINTKCLDCNYISTNNNEEKGRFFNV